MESGRELCSSESRRPWPGHWDTLWGGGVSRGVVRVAEAAAGGMAGFACRLTQPGCSQHFGSQDVKCHITSLFSTGKAAPPLHPCLWTRAEPPAPLPMRIPTGPGARLPVLLHASYAELGKSILNGKAAPGQPCALDKATPNSPWRPPGLTSQEALVCQELAAHLTGLALQVFVYEPNEECA